MALSEEEIKNIKSQIISQVKSWNASDEQKKEAIEQIEDMSEEELEEFLKKNTQTKGKEEKQECPFCSIIQGKIPSYKIDENKSSLAVLEINPLSPGHVLVLSKNHNKLKSSTFTLATKIAKRIKSKLKPEDIKIENAKIADHNLVTIIPIYKDKKLERKKADEKELILMQDKLKAKPKIKKVKQVISETKIENLPVVKKRIP